MSRTEKIINGEYLKKNKVATVLGEVGRDWRRDTSNILCVRNWLYALKNSLSYKM